MAEQAETKSGYIIESKKDATVHCVLIQGSFFFYKSATDPTPKGTFDLKDYTLNFEQDGKSKKKHTFQIIDKSKKVAFTGSLRNPDELAAWKTVLEAAASLPAATPPDRSGAKRAKQGTAMAAKKKMGGAVGKKVMSKMVNEETTTLINALKALVTVESGSKAKADEMEKNIIKIAVKAYLLVDNKDLKGEQFLVADKPLRDAFNLLVKVFNGRGRAKKERVVEALQRVEADLKKAEKVITDLLQPYLSAKNMARLASIFSTVANLKFLETVFYNDSVESELEKLVDAMDYYTQFHYT